MTFIISNSQPLSIIYPAPQTFPIFEDIEIGAGGDADKVSSREKEDILAKRYEIVSIDEFEEGGLPRKLFRVTFRKK